MAVELQNSDKIEEELIHTNHNTKTDNIIKSFCFVWFVLGFIFDELCVRVTSKREVDYEVVTKENTGR